MGLLEVDDKNFPLELKKIKPKVSRLYYEGKLQKNYFQKSLAVVGSRKMTQYGQRVIETILPPLVDAGVTIISGFMYGVDQEVHKITLEFGGMTAAVLGWGIDWKVPESEQKLYKEIEKKGLFFSEYPGEIKPQLWMFPRRNRIMAGLSQGVVVIEAATGSGSLITAQFALKYKKKLLAVPGPLTSAVSAGTNDLIKSGEAKMVTSAEDILREMKWQTDFKTGQKEDQDETKDLILQLLNNEPLTVDELALSIGQTVEKVSVRLSLLQLKGQIEEKEGKYCCKMTLT